MSLCMPKQSLLAVAYTTNHSVSRWWVKHLSKGGIILTTNQIEYQKLLETRRSNAAQEQLKQTELAERQRSNQATERITSARDSATAVHYANQDALGVQQLQEATRHNMQAENDAWASAENDRAVRIATTGSGSTSILEKGVAQGVYDNLRQGRAIVGVGAGSTPARSSNSSVSAKTSEPSKGSNSSTSNLPGKSIGSAVSAAGKWLSSAWSSVSKGAKAGSAVLESNAWKYGNS